MINPQLVKDLANQRPLLVMCITARNWSRVPLKIASNSIDSPANYRAQPATRRIGAIVPLW